jgi:hypothetical protein
MVFRPCPHLHCHMNLQNIKIIDANLPCTG